MQADTLNRIKEYAKRQGPNKQGKVVCPECVDRSSNKHDQCLSIRTFDDHVIYKCHRCEPEFSGRIELKERNVPRKPEPKPAESRPASASESSAGADWLIKERSIPFISVEPYLKFTVAYFSQVRQNLPAISFIYRNDDGVQVYEKFRALEKKLYTSGRSAPGGTDTLYLTEAIDYTKDYLVITEGEFDALVLKTLGFNAVSMPTGANVKWVPHNHSRLSKFKKIFVWFDTDAKGGTVAEKLKLLDPKLTRNFLYISAKKLTEFHQTAKDANDLLRAGATAPQFQNILDTCFEKYSPPYIIRPTSLSRNLIRVRDGSYAHKVQIGEPALDAIISPTRGYAGILTGIPGDGKSTWLTWYAYKLAETMGWRTVFWSPENDPVLMTSELISMQGNRLIQGHPGAQAMTDHEIATYAQWVEHNFRWVQDDEGASDIESILNRMLACAYDMGGVDFLVIDPLNFIKLPNVRDKLEGQKMVYAKIRRFCAEHHCFAFLVAHPKKMDEVKEDGRKAEDDDSHYVEPQAHEKKYKAPGMYSISGTADLVNMANLVATIYRDKEAGTTRLLTTKCSRKFLGSIGSCDMQYQPNTCKFEVLGNRAVDSRWNAPGDTDSPW